MEGRWTIWFSGDDVRARFGQDLPGTPDEPVEVPVVPCDDAAVERAVRALQASSAYLRQRPVYARQLAIAVLRAAGETP